MPFRNRLPVCRLWDARVRRSSYQIRESVLQERRVGEERRKKGAVRQVPARVFKLRPLERSDPCVGSLADLQNLWSRRLLR